MKLRYFQDDLGLLLRFLSEGVEMCVSCYLVPEDFGVPFQMLNRARLQHQKPGVHTILWIKKDLAAAIMPLLETGVWAPIEGGSIFYRGAPLQEMVEAFGLFCLEAHLGLKEAVQTIIGIVELELSVSDSRQEKMGMSLKSTATRALDNWIELLTRYQDFKFG